MPNSWLLGTKVWLVKLMIDGVNTVCKYLFLFALSLSFTLSCALAATNTELERRLDILAEEIETLKLKQQSPKASQWFGLGQSASAVYNVAEGLSIGGYGEVVLTMPNSEKHDGSFNSTPARGEVLRNVLYIGYKYSDKWILNTEIELEHVNEVYVEFAYVDYLHNEHFNWRTGLLLIPMGLVNETHEPIYFNSVNRPEVEKYIIPSTWREMGMGAFGALGKLTYKAYVVNGLNAEGFSSGGIRGGRKKGGVESSSSDGRDFSTIAGVARFDYQLINNLSVGGAYYNGSASSSAFSTLEQQMLQAHAVANVSNAYLKFLYSQVKLDGVREFNDKSGKSVAEEMAGYYFEFGHNFMFGKSRFSPFARYEEVDTQKTVVAGTIADKSKMLTNITFGAAYAPIDRVVFKFDYMKKENEANTGVDQIHASLGYLF